MFRKRVQRRVMVASITAILLLVPVVAIHISAVSFFDDPLGRFSFALPVGWQIQPTPSPDPRLIVALSATDPIGTCRIYAEPAPSSISLDAYATAVLATMTATLDNVVLAPDRSQRMTSGGEEAASVEALVTEAGITLRLQIIAADHGDTAHTVVFVTWAAEQPGFAVQVQTLLDTFSFH